MVDPKDEYPVTLYINKSPRACFKSVKEAQGLCAMPHEHFAMSEMELWDAVSGDKWKMSFSAETWVRFKKAEK